MEDEICQSTPVNCTTFPQDLPRPVVGSILFQDMAGYMPERGDFAYEQDDFAEIDIAELAFEDDDPLRNVLQMGVLYIYQSCLKERAHRKLLIKHYGLLSNEGNVDDLKRYSLLGPAVLDHMKPLMDLFTEENFLKVIGRTLKMFRQLLFLGLLAVTFAAPFRTDLDIFWNTYKKVFSKSYSSFEEGARRLIWENNVARIQKHNLEADLNMHSFKLGINHFSDKVPQEYYKLNGIKIGNRTNSKTNSIFLAPSNAQYPISVDWRKEGLVTEVKDQKACGSCWAFSATGSLEGQHKRKTGKLVSLSEQNLVDCAGGEGNDGCDGGLIDSAFDYVKKHGIDTETSYPYIAKEQKCHFKKENIGATLTGYVDVQENDETDLMKAVATVGPVSVAINAQGPLFMHYKSGIYDVDDCDPKGLNHGVLAVGYGSENGQDYWIVKNSWGPNWGESGYIRMARNKNLCGIAAMASYPLV
ncbi:hypothetical protein JTE90_019917 [Oedothorax gibbosus]|uniref:Cathepsin L n=1 Tax=Oedothorax gibbosus TaxID=931172 RepID=A0AAV6UQS3_9ARAC|nr:hypothetical protein JTE90_019917 [Oedothorax gibbosus]